MYQPDIAKRAMTVEEYKAKAMLLGMTYYANTHTFVTHHPSHVAEYDADTMEVLNNEETGERMRAWLKHRRGY